MPDTRWGRLRLEVEHRAQAGDGGPTLRVRDTRAGDRELLRFDCFERSPHYHVDPPGRDELTPLDPLGDPIAWVMSALREEPCALLEKAGLREGPDASASERDAALHETEALMRNPEPDLDGLDLAVLRSRVSEKWDTYPSDVLAAWVAEMDYPLADPVRRVLQQHIDRHDLGYPVAPRDTGLPEAFAARMADRFDWEIDPARVEILTDVVQSMYWSLLAFTKPGDGIFATTPIYPPFLTSVGETGRHLIDCRLVPRDGRFSFDADALPRLCADGAPLFMLCNPHNPTGRVFSRAELEKLAEQVLACDAVVLTDEIHHDLVYAPREHVPFASLGPEIAARTITVTSATKSFNIPGLRCAVAHFGSQEIQERYRAALPWHVGGGIGLLGLYATQASWRHAQPWLDRVVEYLDGNRRFLADEVGRRWPAVSLLEVEATYLAWLDFSALELGTTPGRFFFKNARIAISDGRHFGAGLERFGRLNFATSRPILTRILDGMDEALRAADLV